MDDAEAYEKHQREEESTVNEQKVLLVLLSSPSSPPLPLPILSVTKILLSELMGVFTVIPV